MARGTPATIGYPAVLLTTQNNYALYIRRTICVEPACTSGFGKRVRVTAGYACCCDLVEQRTRAESAQAREVSNGKGLGGSTSLLRS